MTDDEAKAAYDNIEDTKIGCMAHTIAERQINSGALRGYIAVEGFPMIRDKRFEWDNPGSIRLYEKLGFVKVAEQYGFVVMRKKLK